MLVHLCLFVLLSLMSHIVCIYLIIFEQINDDDDDEDSDQKNDAFEQWRYRSRPILQSER